MDIFFPKGFTVTFDQKIKNNRNKKKRKKNKTNFSMNSATITMKLASWN